MPSFGASFVKDTQCLSLGPSFVKGTQCLNVEGELFAFGVTSAARRELVKARLQDRSRPACLLIRTRAKGSMTTRSALRATSVGCLSTNSRSAWHRATAATLCLARAMVMAIETLEGFSSDKLPQCAQWLGQAEEAPGGKLKNKKQIIKHQIKTEINPNKMRIKRIRRLYAARNAIDSEAIQDDPEAVRDREQGVRQRPCGYALVAPSASSADSSACIAP